MNTQMFHFDKEQGLVVLRSFIKYMAVAILTFISINLTGIAQAVTANPSIALMIAALIKVPVDALLAYFSDTNGKLGGII